MEKTKKTKSEKKFEFLDITTADVAFAAYGRSLNAVFANSALATFEVMVDTDGVKPAKKKKVEVRGHDLQSLMFNWLNELIFLSGSENMVFSKFKLKIDEEAFALNALCAGEKMDPKKHELRTEVKACTYHKMMVKKVGDVWRAQVILDV
ncbi:MAG: archease [Candidatus Syntrophoarchaeum sp.]|nr:archease [Candidatus Syntrophoarchaeum sp.]